MMKNSKTCSNIAPKNNNSVESTEVADHQGSVDHRFSNTVVVDSYRGGKFKVTQFVNLATDHCSQLRRTK
jgi:hypothetical protein